MASTITTPPPHQYEDGEWCYPGKTFEWICCDCDAVHEIHFEIDCKDGLRFQAWRHPERTAEERARQGRV